MPKIGADVDAASLRVADLRAVLREHAVPVPSGARKATLIDAFEMHVRPALLDATKREVGASTAGSGVKEERASGEAEAKAMVADAVLKTDTPVAQGEHDVLRAPAATGTHLMHRTCQLRCKRRLKRLRHARWALERRVCAQSRRAAGTASTRLTFVFQMGT